MKRFAAIYGLRCHGMAKDTDSAARLAKTVKKHEKEP